MSLNICCQSKAGEMRGNEGVEGGGSGGQGRWRQEGVIEMEREGVKARTAAAEAQISLQQVCH